MSIDNSIELNTDTLIQILESLIDTPTITVYCENDNILNDIKKNFSFIEDLIAPENSKNKFILKNNSPILKKKLILLKEIRKKTDIFINIINSLIIKGSQDLSIIGLYSTTSKKIEIDNPNYNIYLEIKNQNELNYGDYIWINTLISDNLTYKKVREYIKYRKFKNINNFKYFKENIEEEDYVNIVSKLNCLLNNKYALSPPIYINEFTDDFINLRIPLDITDEELFKSVARINIIHNYELLTTFKKQKWYDIFYYKNYTNTKIKNKEIMNIYSKTEKRIFNEYKENLNLMNIFLNSFSFINPVLKENIIENMKEYIYDEGDIYAYLKKIRDNLVLYKEFLEIKKNISSLSPKEVYLFDFCYNNSSTIENFINTLSIIPNMLIYKYIDEIEDKNNITISKYDQLEKILEYLRNYIYLLKSNAKNNKILYSDITKDVVKKSDIYSNDDVNKYKIKLINKDIYLNLINNDYKSSIKEFCEKSSLNDKVNIPKNLNFIIETVENLGYKTLKNFNYCGVNLELIVYKDNLNSFIYIQFDALITKSNVTLSKLVFLKENEIPIFYYWSKLFWESKNNELIKLKEFLNSNLGK